MECPICKEQNPEKNNYCAKCGSSLNPLGPLDPNILQQINQSVHAAVKNDLATKEVIQSARQQVAGELIKWGRNIGIPLLFFVVAALGFSSVSDFLDRGRANDRLNRAEDRTNELLASTEESAKQILERTTKLADQVQFELDQVKIASDTLRIEVSSTTQALLIETESEINELKVEFELDVTRLEGSINAQSDRLEETIEVARGCFDDFFAEVSQERLNSLEVGTPDFDTFEPGDIVKENFGLKFTNFGVPIGGIVISPFPENQLFRVVKVGDSICNDVAAFFNASRPDNTKDSLNNNDTLQMTFAEGPYCLRLSMGDEPDTATIEGIRVNFTDVLPCVDPS